MNNCDYGYKISQLANTNFCLVMSHHRAIASGLNSFDCQFSVLSYYNTYLSDYL